MKALALKNKKYVEVLRPVAVYEAELSHAKHWDALAWQEWLVVLATVLASAGSIGLSFVGTIYNLERDGGAVFSTTAAALIVTLIVGVFQIIGWGILLDTKHYETGFRKLGGALCALAFLFFGYGTSSYFNYASITAPSATVIYRSDQIDQLAATMDGLRIKADASAKLLPLVEAEERAGCSAARLEAETGAFSGSAGRGRVSGVLDGICQRATAAAESLRKGVALNAANAAKADAIVARLESLLSDTSIELLERERRITKAVRDLQAVIRQIRAAKMTESVEAFFKTLTTTVAALGSGDGKGFRAAQTLALQELRQGFKEREPIIRELVEKVAEAPVVGRTLDARPSVHEMMWHSVDKHPQNVLLALGIDSFAAFMILVLMLKQPRRRQPTQYATPVQRSRDIPVSLLKPRA